MNRAALAVLLVTLLAGGLRLAGALNDFWLDEIWAYYLAAGAGSIGGVFTKIRVEHHVLTTLYMHLMGEASEVSHRLLSILSGTAAVPLAGLAWIRVDRRAAVAAALLTGLSFPLITYSSEARGYAPAALFCLVAFLLQKEYHRRRSWPALPVIWVSLALALLANPTAFFVMAGLLAWSLGRLHRAGEGAAPALADAAKIHALPWTFAVILYAVLVSRWETIGGNILSLPAVVFQTLALAAGAPPDGQAAPFGAALAAVLLVAGLVIVRRDGGGEWIFFLVALVIAPLFTVLGTGRLFVYPRYFVVLFPFFFLLAARVWAAALGAGAAGRVGAVAALALFSVSSLGETARFLTLGRGHYSDAMRYMAASTPSRVVTVGGDHPFRNGLVLQFYRRAVPGDRPFVYLEGKEDGTASPQWYIVHSPEKGFRPPGEVATPWGTYRLGRHFPYYGLSGFHWAVYRRGDGPADPQEPLSSPAASPLR